MEVKGIYLRSIALSTTGWVPGWRVDYPGPSGGI